MMIVGLTGSIAVGKSEVARMLAAHGIPVFDADKTVHELYVTREMAEEVAKSFPFALQDGQVSRGRLSDHLQAKPEDFGKLEAIVHPRVLRRMSEFISAWKSQGAALVVLDVPLLMEMAGERAVDAVVLVTTSLEAQRQRALARPGMTERKLNTILSRQLPQAAKTRSADYIVENEGSLDELAAKVKALVHDLKSRARSMTT